MTVTASWPTQAEVDAYVASRAPQIGIDPTVAIAVRKSESQTGFIASDGLGGYSYGPFQLDDKGLGPIFQNQTGLSYRDPANWKAATDFALGWAKTHGWTDFHGAANIGISTWQGIATAAGQVGQAILTYFFPIAGYNGDPSKTYHTPGATDLFASIGTAVRNVVQGRVTATGTSGPGGNNILIHGDDGRDYYYAHLENAPSLNVGDFVPGGAQIGKVGNTGNAAGTTPHLHLGIGYGIQNGTGPTGGTGIGFDAQGFLSNLLAHGGQESDPVFEAPTVSPGDISGGIKTGVTGVLDSLHQGIVNYVQDRAAAMVLLVVGIFLLIIAAWRTLDRIPIVKDVASTASSAVGAAAMVA